VGGRNNTNSGGDSIIVGGRLNNIAGFGAEHSAILSGCGNSVCGGSNCSVVLGGQGSCTTADYAAVFGCNLDNSCACSFLANRLRASTLNCNGTVYSNTCTLTNTNPSDRTLKCNITASTYGLCELKQLKPVRYKWINGDGTCNLGFIAQEVREVLPSFVGENADKTLGLYSDRFTPLAVKAVQELNDKLSAQEQRITILEDILKRNNLI
jgi:hypothetical protein